MFEPETEFQFDEKMFGKNPDHPREALQEIIPHGRFGKGSGAGGCSGSVKSGRMTAWSKEDGGVRVFVTGDVVRRISVKQLGPPGVSALLMPSRLD